MDRVAIASQFITLLSAMREFAQVYKTAKQYISEFLVHLPESNEYVKRRSKSSERHRHKVLNFPAKMETELHKLVQQIPTTIDAEQLFRTDDCTDALTSFMCEQSLPLDESNENYYWPTDTDPHAQEILRYVQDNVEKVFPNVCKNA